MLPAYSRPSHHARSTSIEYLDTTGHACCLLRSKALSERHNVCRGSRRDIPVRSLRRENGESNPPVSRPFVERLIGTLRREYLDRIFFWNAVDLIRKLGEFREYYNAHRVHRALAGSTPAQRAGAPSPATAALDHYAWRQHCRGLFHTPIAA